MKRFILLTALLATSTAFAGIGINPTARIDNKELSGDAKEIIYETTSLTAAQEYNHSFRAKAGYTYQAYGDCDNNCTDLDLALIDSKGVTLAADTDNDSVPLFDWTAPASGTYTYRLRMIDCAANDCDASLNVYEGK
ncbi:MAG: hypothetical protein Q4G13_00440 [Moraxella sp.]|nr:hypothetical protein [Moraxella sp.]